MTKNPKVEKPPGAIARLAQRVPVVASLLAAAATAQTASQVHHIPLRDGWTVQLSTKEPATGDQISIGSFTPSSWSPTSVPKAVLAVSVDNKVFPDPYCGSNPKSVPGYLDGNRVIRKSGNSFRAPWWYRVEFSVPTHSKGRVVTLHFDGISYKANVCLNGARIADSESMKGMFRRFEVDVSSKLDYDAKNVLAVQVSPHTQA